jgi:AcrR family transcriptional regulator
MPNQTRERAAVSRPRGRPRAADIDRCILDAAYRLMARQGYARMCMDAVASTP